MTDLSAGSGLSRFAHLTGGISAKAKAEDDDDKKKDDTDAKADADDDDMKASEEDDTPNGDDDDEKKKDTKGKAKSKASALVVAYDEGYEAGFRAAQKRSDAILAHASAGNNFALAAQMATGNRLPVAEAVGIMRAASAAPARHSSGLAARMATVPAIAVGTDADATAGGAAAATPQAEAAAMATKILADARRAGAKF